MTNVLESLNCSGSCGINMKGKETMSVAKMQSTFITLKH